MVSHVLTSAPLKAPGKVLVILVLSFLELQLVLVLPLLNGLSRDPHRSETVVNAGQVL